MKLVLALVGVVAFVACDPGTEGGEKVVVEEGDFFGADILEGSSAAADEEVECIGANEAESNDPRSPVVIRGSVVGPPQTSSRWSFPFVGEAHAVPIDLEVPRSGVVIELRTADTLWRTTTTDALGRFCMRLPALKRFGPEVYLQAIVGDDHLRRFAPTPHAAIVSTQSEAVFRLVSPMQPLSAAELINIQMIADTSADFANLRALDDIERTVVSIERHLRADPRVQNWIAKRR